MEGLAPLDQMFYGNDDLYLGREYIKAVQAATLAVFLTEFEMQLCDPEALDATIPLVDESAYGAVEPLEKVAVRIRKRKM